MRLRYQLHTSTLALELDKIHVLGYMHTSFVDLLLESVS